MKLKKGDSISELTLPSVDGSTFNLESIQGKKAMISFYRYSSCPFCRLRINEFISKKSEFGENFVPIAIFDCDFDDLVKNSKKHDGEITILCDDDRIYFDKFEDELASVLPEPTTSEYETEKDSQEADNEEGEEAASDEGGDELDLGDDAEADDELDLDL